MASFPQMGVPLGLILSTGAVKIVEGSSGDSFENWAWRIPFLFSAVLVAIGLYVRLRVLESPEFTAVREKEAVVKMPVLEVFKKQPLEIFSSAFVRLSEQRQLGP